MNAPTARRGAAVALFVALLIGACGREAGGLEVRDAWMREPAGDSAAVYLTIVNDTGSPDRLVSVSADIAADAELHQTSMSDGKAVMRPVNAIDVRAHSRTELAPGGYHIMLTGLHGRPKAGDNVTIRLRFARAGSRDVRVAVRPLVEDGEEPHDEHMGAIGPSGRTAGAGGT